jgi:MoxR-like ATPase
MVDSAMSSDDVKRLRAMRAAVADKIKDHEDVIDGLFVALFTGGHVLLEANPGLGKTSLAKAFTGALGLADSDFGRIQFTPDLMPADITGTLMPSENDINKLAFSKGPIFKPILLADEINRATPKTQSAMLEAMAEQQVTVLGKTRPLPTGEDDQDGREPFIVIATQNPIDQEGTYELPEAQTDRFMFKFLMRLPPGESLRAIVTTEARQKAGQPTGKRVRKNGDRNEIIDWIDRIAATVRAGELPPAALTHISNVVLATNERFHDCAMSDQAIEAAKRFVGDYLDFPLGPRAAIQLAKAAKGYSTIRTEPDRAAYPDAKVRDGLIWGAVPVLRHRLKFKYDWLDKARESLALQGKPAEAVRERLVYELFRITVPRTDPGYATLVEAWRPAK